jgi:hypothetical protein
MENPILNTTTTTSITMLIAVAWTVTSCTNSETPSPVDEARLQAQEDFGKADSPIDCPEYWYNDGAYCDYYCSWGCDDPDCRLSDAIGSEYCDENVCVGINDSCLGTPCCEGLICNGETSTCWSESPRCAEVDMSCVDTPCCGGFICNGETSTCWKESPRCAEVGMSCVDTPCCDGFICNGETATCWSESPRCGEEGASCTFDTCCEGFFCYSETDTCEPLDMCAQVGEVCMDWFCCDGLTCDGDTCVE